MKETQFMKAYTIKEVSRKINVPSGTIRQWEKDLDGLLAIPRTRQGARFYTDQEIEMLKKIKQMRDKNLSKDMIRELLKNHLALRSEEGSESVETSLPAVQEPPVPTVQPANFDFQGFFDALEAYKHNLLHDVKTEIQTGLRTEIINEVKKDIASGSLQTIKALSLSINRSKQRMQADLEELSTHVAMVSEHTSESLETLTNNITAASNGTTEKISALSENVAKLSKGTTREISTLSDNISKVSNGTKKEMAALKENVTKISKGTAKDISSLSENVTKLSKGTAKEISSLSSSISKLSKGTSEEMNTLAAKIEESAEEFKILTDYISESKEITVGELSTLNNQLAMDREYYLETLKLERDHFRSAIQQRDEIFKDLVVNFREAAAAKDEPKKWWKVWK